MLAAKLNRGRLCQNVQHALTRRCLSTRYLCNTKLLAAGASKFCAKFQCLLPGNPIFMHNVKKCCK